METQPPDNQSLSIYGSTEMTSQDNLRDRIAYILESHAHMPMDQQACAIIDELHLEAYDFTRHDGHTTTHVHGWAETQ